MLTLSAGLGFGPTTPGLAQAEDFFLGHEGLRDTKSPNLGAERENHRERHPSSAGCQGRSGEPRPGGGDAPTLSVSSISATPDSHPGCGVSPRQSPDTHLHPGSPATGTTSTSFFFFFFFPQPVAYKDLCLTCLWERSVKGTDSRLGRCLPSIPTTHFPTIINRAGSYHQPKRGSASEVPRARWYLYPRHIGARSQRKGALACVVSTALPSSASLLPHRRAGRKKKNHPGGVFRGPQRLWGGPSSVCVAQRGCQPRHDLAVGGLAGGDESWAEGKAGRALAEIPVIWGFFGVVFFCFLGSCNVLAVSLWIWELILWLRGHHLGRAVLFFSPLFSGVDARSEQQKAAETQVDKRASPGTPSARFWGAPAGHGAPQPPGEHRQEALAPILGSGWRRTEEQHQRGAAPRGNKLHPLSASPHRGQAVPGGFCRATHPRGLRRF
ncbi:uncharacterized protein FYW23_013535 isoform 1-T1 [Sylvia borin]